MNAYKVCMDALDQGWLPVVVPCADTVHIVQFRHSGILKRVGAFHYSPTIRQAVSLGAAMRAVSVLKELGCDECARDRTV